MALTNNQLADLPKIELHVHLDGSVLPQTLIELAEMQGSKLPTTDSDELLRYMSAPQTCQSLNDYLRTFDFVLPYMQTYEALERTAYELVKQCAAEQVQYVEVRFAPQLHRERGLSVAETYEAVIAGLTRGEQQFNVIARCIGICLRGHSESQNVEVVQVAAQYWQKGVVAVDLAGAEALYPPQLYEAVFHEAQQSGIPVTIHAGEAAGAESIAVAIEQLGAQRIGHGVRLQENMELLQDVVTRRIPLEFCPISNLQTKAIADWEHYPIVSYMEQGVIVTVNTDNLTVSQTSLGKELMALQTHCGLSAQAIVQLQRNAAHAIFLEQPAKQQFIAAFESKLAKWLENNPLAESNL